MVFETHAPSGPVAEFVELFWFFAGHAGPSRKERLLPTATTELVFNLSENETRTYDPAEPKRPRRSLGGIVSGPHSEFFAIDGAGPTALLGVHFKPAGARPFFRDPACEFHNTHVALRDVWGSPADDLRDRLVAAASARAKFRVLEQALLARLQTDVCHPAVAFAVRTLAGNPGRQSIRELTAQIGFSARHFIEIFSAEVGLTPKLFARVCRFHDVVRRIHPRAAREIDWADVAVASGYYDQAHFIHDFHLFSGLTPSDYLARRTPHMNHVPVA
jgi:methylphosphotriester-DNA--protein-cysteine methyltransferase